MKAKVVIAEIRSHGYMKFMRAGVSVYRPDGSRVRFPNGHLVEETGGWSEHYATGPSKIDQQLRDEAITTAKERAAEMNKSYRR